MVSPGEEQFSSWILSVQGTFNCLRPFHAIKMNSSTVYKWQTRLKSCRWGFWTIRALADTPAFTGKQNPSEADLTLLHRQGVGVGEKSLRFGVRGPGCKSWLHSTLSLSYLYSSCFSSIEWGKWALLTFVIARISQCSKAQLLCISV